MSINAIGEAIKSLAQAFQIANIFPAIIWISINAYFIAPRVFPGYDSAAPHVVTLIIALITTVSYTLYAFNFPLIRLLEGYRLQETDIMQSSLSSQKAQRQKLNDQIEKLREKQKYIENDLGFDPSEDRDRVLTPEQKEQVLSWVQIRVELAKCEQRLNHDYASSVLMPTKLGNTIAAFEDYPRTRYGMETIVLWPRILPILKRVDYLGFVSQEKAVFDFLLNMGFVAVVLGLETICLGFLWGDLLMLGFALFLMLTSWIWYEGMIVAARQWGITVCVAFDLYRHQLRRELTLRETSSFAEEFGLWKRVSKFLLYRQDEVHFEDFMPAVKVDAQDVKERQ